MQVERSVAAKLGATKAARAGASTARAALGEDGRAHEQVESERGDKVLGVQEREERRVLNERRAELRGHTAEPRVGTGPCGGVTVTKHDGAGGTLKETGTTGEVGAGVEV